MHFSTSALLALVASPLLALAQGNSFNIPSSGLSFKAGTATTVKWTPSTGGTITLVLRSGASSDLDAGTVIASSISNSGSYTWTPDSTITRGSDYTLEIVDDQDPSNVNYTPYFVIDSTNTVASSTGDVTLGATSPASALSTASNTGSVTTGLSASTTVLSGTHTSSAHGSSSTSGSSGSSDSSSTSGSSDSTSSGASMTTSGSSSQTTSGDAGFQSTSASAATQTGAGARATAAAGMMGLVALGAMAL